MKAILICPAGRDKVAALSETVPLSNLPVFGRSLVGRWFEHLAELGAKEVFLLASDRPDQVRKLVGDGARWGVIVKIVPERGEITPAEARQKYAADGDGPWLPAPHDAVLMDHLPGLPEFPLFTSYAAWFRALCQWMPRAARAPSCLGVREIKPGVWIGLRARIARDVELRAPSWIGEDVCVGPGAIIGGQAILESKSVVERGVQISHSVIGPETYVGGGLEVRNSIAVGDRLVNWETDSSVKVPDKFLLCSFKSDEPGLKPLNLLGRLLAAAAFALTVPVVLPPLLMAKLRRRPVVRARAAVRPRLPGHAFNLGETLVYHELTNAPGWLRRWPQLWSVARGHFAWIGNRPLNPSQAARLSSDFERLWLTVPPGLISLADAEGCPGGVNAAACAHACFYAVRNSWRQDLRIFARAFYRLAVAALCSRTGRRYIHTSQSRAGFRRAAST